MRKKGEITVFLSMVLAVLLFFLEVCLESARLSMLRSQAQEALELAEYSVLSEFHRELLERYDLFYLDLGYGSGQEDVEYLKQRIRQFLNENLGQGRTAAVEVFGISRASDGNGQAFYEQAVSCMKQKTGTVYLEKWLGLDTMGQQAEEEQKKYEEADRREQKNLEELKRRRVEEEESGTPDPTSETQAMKRSGILTLVLKDLSLVSGKRVDLSGVPSMRTRLQGSGPRGRYEAGPVNDGFFLAYLLEHFSSAVDFLTEEEQPGTWLDYQLEYQIAGNASDLENLESVCLRLLAMREGVNYAYLLTDAAKVAECEAMAAALVGATLIPGLVEALKQVLLLAWAFAESVLDVRRLLAGEQVAFWKTGEIWKLSLEQMLDLKGSLDTGDAEGDDGGLGYQEYLGILLMATGREIKLLRGMDVIEGVVRGVPDCRGLYVDQCTDGFLVRAVCQSGRELSAERWFCYEW